ncbi:MAG: dipeptide ABC transporter ATP-binding protein [Immundisolibacteraceae bacterium]|nr:dipeptide ABC transporter ATP-binding protein [Immundisolibacteraceae bacterium]
MSSSSQAIGTGIPLLQIRDLQVQFRGANGLTTAVERLSMDIDPGQTLVLLGESGSGKSVTALSIMGLLPPAAVINNGSILFNGLELTKQSNAQLRNIRGSRIGIVFQEPMTSLNPVMTVGKQIIEAIPRKQNGLSSSQVRQRGVELLAQMGIPEPARRFHEFPHQLSGGMKQRVMIAIALAGEPDLLIADEPTTALDVTTQAQILELLKQLQQERNMALLLVTHDFGIAAQMADKVAVMRHGEIVEAATSKQFFSAPQHPYSKKLFAALPNMSKRGQRLGDESLTKHPNPEPANQHTRDSQQPILAVTGLQVLFQRHGSLFKPKEYIYAVDGVSFNLQQGETLAIVGESGCGKSTLVKSLLQLIRANNGSVKFRDQELTQLTARQLRPKRRHLQIVFQDPYSSLNPRMLVRDIIQEGMVAQNIGGNASQRAAIVESLLADVGLEPEALERYPHEFSGGQRQRIGIARALAVEPELLLLDEPTSALDLSVQAQILDLLATLQQQRDLTYIFVSHDLSVVEYFADRVAVMYLGRIIELGPATEIMTHPAHPYTQALLSAVPTLDTSDAKKLSPALPGEPPSPGNRPTGCHFHPRCQRATDRCRSEFPEVTQVSPLHAVNCHHPLDSGRPD